MPTKIAVSTSSSQIFDKAPNLVRDAVVESILEDADEALPYIQASILKRMDITTDRLHRYTLESFPESVPSSTLQIFENDGNSIEDAVANFVATHYDINADNTTGTDYTAIVLESEIIDGGNPEIAEYIAFSWLYRYYGWDGVHDDLRFSETVESVPKEAGDVEGTTTTSENNGQKITTVVIDSTTKTTTVRTNERYLSITAGEQDSEAKNTEQQAIEPKEVAMTIYESAIAAKPKTFKLLIAKAWLVNLLIRLPTRTFDKLVWKNINNEKRY